MIVITINNTTAHCVSDTAFFSQLESVLHLTNQNSRGGAQESVYVIRSPEASENQLNLANTSLRIAHTPIQRHLTFLSAFLICLFRILNKA